MDSESKSCQCLAKQYHYTDTDVKGIKCVCEYITASVALICLTAVACKLIRK